MTDTWSKIEVTLIVADYFDMLIKELSPPIKKLTIEDKYYLYLITDQKDQSNLSIKISAQY
jgi:hypothetical protein